MSKINELKEQGFKVSKSKGNTILISDDTKIILHQAKCGRCNVLLEVNKCPSCHREYKLNENIIVPDIKNGGFTNGENVV